MFLEMNFAYFMAEMTYISDHPQNDPNDAKTENFNSLKTFCALFCTTFKLLPCIKGYEYSVMTNPGIQ